MSLSHLIHRERKVYLGGRAIRLGSRFLVWGGRWYTVGPISLLRFIQLYEAMNEDWVRGRGLVLREALLSLKPMAPLMVREAMRDRDYRSISPRQVLLLVSAFEVCNDLEYLDSQLATPKEGEGAPASWAHTLATFMRTFHQSLEYALHMSAAAFFELLETLIPEKDEDASGTVPAAGPVKPPDRPADEEMLKKLGLLIEVPDA